MDSRRITNRAIITWLEHPFVEFFVRCILAAVFLAAAFNKINAIGDFAHSILNYELFSFPIALFVATVLPWLELLCSISLLLGIYQRGATVIITSLLVIFTLLVLWALIVGLDISCGCFTQSPNAQKIGWLKAIENCGLLLLALFLFSRKGTSWNIFSFFDKKSEAPSP